MENINYCNSDDNSYSFNRLLKPLKNVLPEQHAKKNDIVKLEGMSPDFSKTIDDYAKYRQGFPEDFFTRLSEKNILVSGSKALDIGTGTGTLARGMATHGCKVTGLDLSESILKKANEISKAQHLEIIYKVGSAENTGMQDNEFDIVTVGQAWHWFNHDAAILEIRRVLKANGVLIIGHFDWLPLVGSVPALTESLIMEFNPSWKGANGTGFYPQWAIQLREAGFTSIETYSFEKLVIYSHEAWRGRIRASAGTAATLSTKEVEMFDQKHAQMLEQFFPEGMLKIPHRCFTLIAHPASKNEMKNAR